MQVKSSCGRYDEDRRFLLPLLAGVWCELFDVTLTSTSTSSASISTDCCFLLFGFVLLVLSFMVSPRQFNTLKVGVALSS